MGITASFVILDRFTFSPIIEAYLIATDLLAEQVGRNSFPISQSPVSDLCRCLCVWIFYAISKQREFA